MDRKRIREEVIEILANKLHKLPPPPPSWEEEGEDEEPFDYDAQVIKPEITDNHLDIAEVAMDLEDAFGVNFEDALPGDAGMESIGKVIDYIQARIQSAHAKTAKKDDD
jgi:acyl carrier protein